MSVSDRSSGPRLRDVTATEEQQSGTDIVERTCLGRTGTNWAEAPPAVTHVDDQRVVAALVLELESSPTIWSSQVVFARTTS